MDIFVSWDKLKKEGIVIGGNVGDAVSMRKISLQTMIADGTTHIVDVRGTYTIKREVQQQRYEIVSTQKIHATWYGGKFHNRRTASGVKFDTTKLTGAHKTLPFGTEIIVENIQTGKKIKIEINDRCPKSGILDLSKAAADSIGIRSGKVIIHILRKL